MKNYNSLVTSWSFESSTRKRLLGLPTTINSTNVCRWSYFNHVWLFVTLSTLNRQAPLSMGFSRQEYWSGLPYSPPGDLPNPGIEPSFISCIYHQCHLGIPYTNNHYYYEIWLRSTFNESFTFYTHFIITHEHLVRKYIVLPQNHLLQ